MKVYKCDSCGVTIQDPYEVNMKEFYLSPLYDYGMVLPVPTRRKIKIDLCKDCFKGLCLLAEKVAGENNVE